jgi:formylglycine-generating enzyme required for sulfatase activity
LPTEAEWEYACRAGTTTPYHYGEALAVQQANYNAVDKEVTTPEGKTSKLVGPNPHTVKVGTYQPNAWGLYDMHGNVTEWVADWYDEHYYAKSPADDPKGPETAGTTRVTRGGSWFVGRASCRSAGRHGGGPAYRDYIVGFRVVCTTPR